ATPVATSINFDFGYHPGPPAGGIHPLALARGSGPLADFVSFILPLDFQKPGPLPASGGSITNSLPFLTNASLNPVIYHFNATNSAASGQTNLALRIKSQNPIAAFGARVGGSALYTDRSHRFIIYAGAPSTTNAWPWINGYADALKIDVYARSNF